MVQWIDELKQTSADNIQGLIPSNSVPAKILKGGATGLSNFGYDTANFIAGLPTNGFVNPAYIPKQFKEDLQAINQSPAMIKQGIKDFKANPIEKTAEAAGYLAGGLALGGVGVKATPKATPKVAPKVTPKTISNIPTIPKNNSGANIKVSPKPTTVQGLTERSKTVTNKTPIKEIETPNYIPNDIEPALKYAMIESRITGKSIPELHQVYKDAVKTNATDLVTIDKNGNIINPIAGYVPKKQQVKISALNNNPELSLYHEYMHMLQDRLLQEARSGNAVAKQVLDDMYGISNQSVYNDELLSRAAQWTRPEYTIDLRTMDALGYTPEQAMNAGVYAERLFNGNFLE